MPDPNDVLKWPTTVPTPSFPWGLELPRRAPCPWLHYPGDSATFHCTQHGKGRDHKELTDIERPRPLPSSAAAGPGAFCHPRAPHHLLSFSDSTALRGSSGVPLHFLRKQTRKKCRIQGKRQPLVMKHRVLTPSCFTTPPRTDVEMLPREPGAARIQADSSCTARDSLTLNWMSYGTCFHAEQAQPNSKASRMARGRRGYLRVPHEIPKYPQNAQVMFFVIQKKILNS